MCNEQLLRKGKGGDGLEGMGGVQRRQESVESCAQMATRAWQVTWFGRQGEWTLGTAWIGTAWRRPKLIDDN